MQCYTLSPLTRVTSSASNQGNANWRLAGDIALKYGHCYDSYNVIEDNRFHFWYGNSLIGFIERAGVICATGGILGPLNEHPACLQAFREFAIMNGKHILFLGITSNEISTFKDEGFKIAKAGEEAIIELGSFSLKGKTFSKLRQNLNRARKELFIVETDFSTVPQRKRNELCARARHITSEFLAAKTIGEEISFFQGKFQPSRHGRRRLFEAKRRDNPSISEGFLVCNPYSANTGWSAEITHKSPLATRGTSHLLLAYAAEVFKNEGYRLLSLTMVPGKNAMQENHFHPVFSRLLALSYTLGSAFYDMRGLYRYKRTFAPRFEPVYIGFYPRLSFKHALAGLSCVQLRSINLWIALNNLFKNSQR